MSVVNNPLDHTSVFLVRAINLTYIGLTCAFPPTIYELEEYLPAHFRQELCLEISIAEEYSIIGAGDQEEFVEMVAGGEYDRFIPNKEAIRLFLNDKNLAYLEKGEYGYQLRNCSVVEVW